MRKIILTLVLVLFSVILVACGGNEEDEDPTIKVVTVWVHKSQAEDEGKTYLAIQDLFNEEEFYTETGKRIRMRIEFKNSAETLQTAINAEVLTGGLPDIIALDSPNVAAYVDAGILTHIDDHITTEEKSDYVDSTINQGTIDDQLYALFAMDAPVGLYYNKTILAQANITPGSIDNPWSWYDLFEASAALKALGLPYKFKTNLGFGGVEGAMYLYSSLVYSAGGSFIGSNGKVGGALDSELSVNGLEIVETFFSGTTEVPDLMYDGVNTDALAAGEVAFELYGPWGVDAIKKNYPDFVNQYDIMPTPVYENSATGDKGEIASGSGSWGFGVTTASNDVEAAATVLKYLTSAESSELLYQTIGTFPTHKSTLENSQYFQAGALKSLSEILIYTSNPRPKFVKYPELSLAYSKIFDYIEATYDSPDYDLVSYIQSQIYSVDN